MLVYLFLAASVCLQLSAAILAFRLIKITGRRLAWILISVGLFLMAARRILPLAYSFMGSHAQLDPVYEGIGLALSACMLAGVTLIKPIFERIFESEEELEESEKRFRSYFELPIVGVAILSPDYRWATANDRVCEILGRTRQELLGRPVEESSAQEDLAREEELRRAVVEGKADGFSLDKRFAKPSAPEPIWTNQAVRCVRDAEGEIDYYVTIIQDISERKAFEAGLRGSMKEKEILLRELYHRTKNNMQVICSLLNLECASCGDPRLVEEFRVIENRIRSMSLVHEKLYQSRNLASINLGDYIRDLAALLQASYSPGAERIGIATELESVQASIDAAVPCGLIVNELVANCLRHAFPSGGPGMISIRLSRREGGLVELRVEDDGVGLPRDFEAAGSKGIGVKTARALAEQLGGELDIGPRQGGGTRCLLSFAAPKAAEDPVGAAAGRSDERKLDGNLYTEYSIQR